MQILANYCSSLTLWPRSCLFLLPRHGLATDTQFSRSSLDTAHLPINRSRDNTNPLIYVSLLTPDPRRDLWKLFKCKSDKNEMVSILVKSSVSGLSNLQIEQIYEVLGDVACTGSTGVYCTVLYWLYWELCTIWWQLPNCQAATGWDQDTSRARPAQHRNILS